MFPTHKLNEHTFTPTTILKLLAIDDSSRFMTLITNAFIYFHLFFCKLTVVQIVLLQTTVAVFIHTGTLNSTKLEVLEQV